MKNQCECCGKKAILDQYGHCYECADFGERNKAICEQEIVPQDSKVGLYFIMLIVNNLLVMLVPFIVLLVIAIEGIGHLGMRPSDVGLVLDESSYAHILIYKIVSFSIYTIAVDIFRIIDLFSKRKKFICWKEPLINLIPKFITMLIPIGCYIDVAIDAVVSWKIYNKFNVRDLELEEVNRKKFLNNTALQESSILSDISVVPEAVLGKWAIEQETLETEVNKAKKYIERFPICDEEKQELLRYFMCRGTLPPMTNDMKYWYCQVINKMLENEIPYYDYESCFVMRQEYYDLANYMKNREFITKPIFEMGERVNNEIVVPYMYITNIWNQNLRNSEIFKNECSGITLGYTGEKQVEQLLQEYEGQIITLSNLRIEVEGNSIESDFVILSPYGIYVLEVKNLGNGGRYGLRVAKDGRWTRISGKSEKEMKSPIAQNERHILYLEKYLNNKLGRSLDEYIRVQGMVVLANDKVNIENETDDIIIRYHNIMNTMRKNPIVMKETEMQEMARILEEASLPPKSYKFNNCENPFWEAYLPSAIFGNYYMSWIKSVEPLKEYVDAYLQKDYIEGSACQGSNP